MPPPQPVRRSPGSLSFGKKICCSSAFIVKKYQAILVWNMCYDSMGRLPRDCLVAQRSLVAAGQLAPSAALRDLWNPWETSRASSTDGCQPPPHLLHSLWLPNQYFHRQFKIPKLDLLWMCTPPASACNHFLPFLHDFSMVSGVESLNPQSPGISLSKGSYSIICFAFREPCFPLPKQKKGTLQWQLDQIPAWGTNNSLALVSVFTLGPRSELLELILQHRERVRGFREGPPVFC